MLFLCALRVRLSTPPLIGPLEHMDNGVDYWLRQCDKCMRLKTFYKNHTFHLAQPKAKSDVLADARWFFVQYIMVFCPCFSRRWLIVWTMKSTPNHSVSLFTRDMLSFFISPLRKSLGRELPKWLDRINSIRLERIVVIRLIGKS